MAKVSYDGKTIQNPQDVSAFMQSVHLIYEHWPVFTDRSLKDEQECLETYKKEIDLLKKQRGYEQQDVVCLSPETPQLDMILNKFKALHYHTDDEVRFTVEGSGVFEIEVKDPHDSKTKMVQFTAESGDLIVIPKDRPHLFYLTEEKYIRCIRLFQDTKGWEAFYV